jgi:magnesium transporter
MREVLNTITRRDTVMPEALRPYFEDLYDHVLRAAEWTESLRDMISSVFETNLSLQDARLNTIMKQLTSWAAIIAIPTAVTGFYGQNVPYPGFGQHWGFYSSAGIMVSLVVILFVTFKRKGWL